MEINELMNNISFDDMEVVNMQLLQKQKELESVLINNTNYSGEMVEVTEQLIEDGMTGSGGFKYSQLHLLGVETPPKSGWKEKVLGTKIPKENAEKYLALKGHMRKAEQRTVLETGAKPNLIEITEEEKNIILYCIEEVYRNDLEQGKEIRAETTKAILDKLVAIKKKEQVSGTFKNSYFF